MFPHTFGAPTVHLRAGGAGVGGGAARPLRVGAVLSGGQAPGGHNVLSGIFDALKRIHPESVFIGFLDGPRGLFKGDFVEVDAAMIARYRNMGGFDAIGSGRDKIETPEQFAGARAVAEKLRLDGVVIIGGDDSNTNAAVLAEYFKKEGCTTRVVGAPKVRQRGLQRPYPQPTFCPLIFVFAAPPPPTHTHTHRHHQTIDGDLKIPGYVDVSFGFDTACRTYSELIGNLCVDALSAGKYWHFIRLMGRAASNITLECALATHPNVALIGEEVAARHQNLASVTEEIVNVIAGRAAAGKNYGVVLVPEGLIEFVPEISVLLSEINELLAHGTPNTVAAVADALSMASAGLFGYLPPSIKQQLLADRDPHGNVQVSLIETEKLLAELVQHELDKRARAGQCPLPTPREGVWPTSFQFHFFGYEGRCALPCDFDTVYCYALGMVAATLLHHGCTGLMSSVTKLGAPVSEWECAGVPLTAFFNVERRHGKDKPVIKKALVELHELPFRTFLAARGGWALTDAYRNPGPTQLHESGDRVELCHTLALEYEERAAGGGGGGGAPALTPAPAARQGEAALESYVGLLEGMLGDGAAPSAHDLQRLLSWRLAHKVTDALHARALESIRVPLSTFKVWEAVLHK